MTCCPVTGCMVSTVVDGDEGLFGYNPFVTTHTGPGGRERVFLVVYEVKVFFY